MHEGAASITTSAKTVAWGVALVFVVGLCAGLARPARAQDAASRPRPVDYNAPADCPSRAEFERRLDTRLRASPEREHAAVRLSVELTRRGDGYRGALTMSRRGAVVGQRTIEASSCSEAVDALAFVAALLVDDRARAEAPRARATPATGRTSRERARGETPRSSSDTNAVSRESTRGSPATTAAEGLSDPAATKERAKEPNANPDETDATGASPQDAAAQAQAPEPIARAVAEVTARAEAPAEPPSPRTPFRFEGELGVGALLVSGVAAALRPGLELRATGFAVRGRFGALSGGLGVRATLPHEQTSPEGAGRFGWWSGVLALCAGMHSHDARVGAALCLNGEAGRVVAHGRATADARSARPRWLALGPALQLRARVWGPVWLVSGAELLWPSTRDRFVVGDRQLHKVPRLTFRAQLAAAVHWP